MQTLVLLTGEFEIKHAGVLVFGWAGAVAFPLSPLWPQVPHLAPLPGAPVKAAAASLSLPSRESCSAEPGACISPGSPVQQSQVRASPLGAALSPLSHPSFPTPHNPPNESPRWSFFPRVGIRDANDNLGIHIKILVR